MIEPELLLQGYRLGVFPMAMEDDSIAWFSPDPRAILPLNQFHVPHDLRRVQRKQAFEIKIDHGFGEVIRACAKRKDTWINHEIIESYVRLHELGFAHSVEAWSNGKLAGGLYGVAIGGAFFGESMFHKVTDASKIALVALFERLHAKKLPCSTRNGSRRISLSLARSKFHGPSTFIYSRARWNWSGSSRMFDVQCLRFDVL
jgi:leucyl/phenylalanyl-tRNA--protein transferase